MVEAGLLTMMVRMVVLDMAEGRALPSEEDEEQAIATEDHLRADGIAVVADRNLIESEIGLGVAVQIEGTVEDVTRSNRWRFIRRRRTVDARFFNVI
jgi:hypothetical protein